MYYSHLQIASVSGDKIGDIDEDEEDGESTEQLCPIDTDLPKLNKFVPQWRSTKPRSSVNHSFQWTLEKQLLSTNESPWTLFEHLFSDEIVQHICSESKKYAISRGNMDFSLDKDEFKLFLSILLISGYS